MLSKATLTELKKYIQDHQEQCLELSESKMMSFETVQQISMPVAQRDYDLDDYINRRKKPGFTETLFAMMDAHGGKDSEIYTKAGLDRRHFSKIRSNPNYQPSKHTAIALALALNLNIEKAKELLSSAGYTLTESETFDLIITWCIDKGIYDLKEVNQALDYFSQKTIGTIA